MMIQTSLGFNTLQTPGSDTLPGGVQWDNRRLVSKTTVFGAPPAPKVGPGFDMDLRRHAAPDGCITYTFGNPTVWGNQAASFVAGSKATVWGAAEAHLDRERLGKLEAKPMQAELQGQLWGEQCMDHLPGNSTRLGTWPMMTVATMVALCSCQL